MSAYASALFQGMPPLRKASKKEVSAPPPLAETPSTTTGIALPPLKLSKANNNRSETNACPKTPARYRNRRGSTTAATSPTGTATSSANGNPDPFIWVESTNLNVHLLTMSPRKIIRRGSGGVGTSLGGGLAYSPRRQARTVGGDGILDAIEVDLTITSSGRTYQATRSLARIVELSTDLIVDAMEDEDVAAIPILPDEVKLMSLGPPPSPPASRAAIGGSGGGDAGGLVHLQHRLDHLKHQLNSWFNRLLASVGAGSSVALSAFVWEPLWLADSSSKGNGSGCSGTSSRSKCAAGDVPLAQSLSNDSTQSSCSGNAFGVTAPATNSSFHISTGSGGTLPPLAFGSNKSWKPARVRRGSENSVSTLSSIDETLLF